MVRMVRLLLIALLVGLVLGVPSTGSASMDPRARDAAAFVRGTDTPEQAVRGLMRTANRGAYKAARKFASARVVRSARQLRQQYGFRFTSLQYCEPGESSLYWCLSYIRRTSDGMEGSVYFEVEGTPGNLIAWKSYASFGD